MQFPKSLFSRIALGALWECSLLHTWSVEVERVVSLMLAMLVMHLGPKFQITLKCYPMGLVDD